MSGLTGEVALGGASLSLWAEGRDRDADLAMIRAAADAGVTIFDTARAYATPDDAFHNEHLFREALAGRDVLVSTKGGHWRVGERWETDNTPARLRADVDDSLRGLGVERIDLYYVHRVDFGTTPLPDSVHALAELRDAGKIERIGLANITADQLDQALAVAPIDAVQNLHTARRRDSQAVLDRCAELGIPFFGFSPFWRLNDPEPGAFPRLTELTRRRGVSLHRLLLRGLLAASPVSSVIVGPTRRESALDSVVAAAETWDDELAEAERADRAEAREA